MHKKGQNWSIEMIITTALFITFFITFIGLTYLASTGDLREVEIISNELSQRLLSQTDPISIVDSRNGIDKTKLNNLASLSYPELQRSFGVTEDFCLILEDELGNVILIQGKNGVGSSAIRVNGVACAS